MKAAILRDLLTPGELRQIEYMNYGNVIRLDYFIHNLTVRELNDISLILITTELQGQLLHSCVLAAKAIEILTQRAVEKKLIIFE